MFLNFNYNSLNAVKSYVYDTILSKNQIPLKENIDSKDSCQENEYIETGFKVSSLNLNFYN